MHSGFTRGGCVLIAASLSACGGSQGTPITPLPLPQAAPITSSNPTPSPLPPASTSPSTHNYDTAEFKNSNAAVLSNSITAYQNGATGKGTKIGIVDTGINPDHPEFLNKLDPASRDVAGNRSMTDSYGHGTAVASIAAGARDEIGSHGVAFDSTIVVMKADAPGTCPASCSFTNVAEAIDASRVAGARVINLSMGGASNPQMLEAVRRAAAAGIVIVVAAGNDGSANPTAMARDIAQAAPGQVIIAGGLGLSSGTDIDYNQLISYSNRAGSSQQSYLASPAFLIQAASANGGFDHFSGTSFAAPVVSGAVAILAQAFPTLSAKQIVDILLTTSDDLGVAGVDPIFGTGRINVGRAFQPIGKTTVAGTRVELSTKMNGTLPAAAGDATLTSSMPAIIVDEYARAFHLNVAATLEGAVRHRLLENKMVGSSMGYQLLVGPLTLATVRKVESRLRSAAVSTPYLPTAEVKAAERLAASAVARLPKNASVAIGVFMGSKSLERQLGTGAPVRSMITQGAGSELSFTGRPIRAAAFRVDRGQVGATLSRESGTTSEVGESSESLRYGFTTLSIDRRGPKSLLAMEISHLVEAATVLGGKFGPIFGEVGSDTYFARFQIEHAFGRGWSLGASAKRGLSHFTGGQVTSGAYSFEVAKSGIQSGTDELALQISQPLRIEKGGFLVSLPSAYDYASQSATYRTRFLSLVPSKREIAAELLYTGRRGESFYQTNLYVRMHPGHISTARPDVGAAIRLNIAY